MGGMSGAGMGGGDDGSYFGGKYIDFFHNYKQQTQGYKANKEYWDAMSKGNAQAGYVYDPTKDTVSASAFESGDYGKVNWRYLKEQGWTLEQIQEYYPEIYTLTPEDDTLPEGYSGSTMNPKAIAEGAQQYRQKGERTSGTQDEEAFTDRSTRTTGTEDTGDNQTFFDQSAIEQSNYGRSEVNSENRQQVSFDNWGLKGYGNREGLTYDEYGNASIDSSYFTEDRGWTYVGEWTSTSGDSSADTSGMYYSSKKTTSKGKSQSNPTGSLSNQVFGWLQN